MVIKYINEGVFDKYSRKEMTTEDKKKKARKDIQKIYDKDFQERLEKFLNDPKQHISPIDGEGDVLLQEQEIICSCLKTFSMYFAGDRHHDYPEYHVYLKGSEQEVGRDGVAYTKKKVLILIPVSIYDRYIWSKNNFTSNVTQVIKNLTTSMSVLKGWIARNKYVTKLCEEFGFQLSVNLMFKYIDLDNKDYGLEGFRKVLDDTFIINNNMNNFSCGAINRVFSLFVDFFQPIDMLRIEGANGSMFSPLNNKEFENVVLNHIKCNYLFLLNCGTDIEELPDFDKLFYEGAEDRCIDMTIKNPTNAHRQTITDKFLQNYVGKSYKELLKLARIKSTDIRTLSVIQDDPDIENSEDCFAISELSFNVDKPLETLRATKVLSVPLFLEAKRLVKTV